MYLGKTTKGLKRAKKENALRKKLEKRSPENKAFKKQVWLLYREK